MSKNIQKTKLILHGHVEDIDLSSLVTEMHIPRFPTAVDSVQVTLTVDQFHVDQDGTLTVCLRSE